MQKNKTLVVIVGPTAIGKTAMAIQVAQYYNTEIISSDSRQFYKEMTIGTAVPSKLELAAVPHHFIHHKSIHEPYSVGDFEKEAIAYIESFFQDHDVLVMVGGSGLYEKAVTEGLDEFPDVPENYRNKLNKALDESGLAMLQKELKEKDPVYYQEVDQDNAHRIIRALEIIRFSGKPFSYFRSQKKKTRDFNIIKIGLKTDRDVIYDRINQRVDAMMTKGLLDEVKSLAPYKNLNALQTVGYREIFSYLDDEISLEEAVEEIKKNTRRFAKRQLTWYRKDEQVKWFAPQEATEVLAYLKQKI
ncbi:MAG: tRNA (adenosine(37)-N6)-dimethylallyltransferase MiaA [Weeksellaceae bacterium]